MANMPGQETDSAATKGGRTGGRQLRLHTSCDRCQTAKVKCSQTKPSCWRCSQSGVDCIYSPYRTIGRPPKDPASSASAAAAASAPVSDNKDDNGNKSNSNNKESSRPYKRNRATRPSSEHDRLSVDPPLIVPTDAADILGDTALESWVGAAADIIPSELDMMGYIANVSPDTSLLGLSSASANIASLGSPLDGWMSSTRGAGPGEDETSFSSLAMRHDSFLASQDDDISAGSVNEMMQGVVSTVGEPSSRNGGIINPVLDVFTRIQCFPPVGTDTSLDQLLSLDHNLHCSVSSVLASTTPYQSDSSILLILMTQDVLVAHFEARRNSTQGLARFLYLDQALSLGTFALDDKIKTALLRQLVLGFLDKTATTATQLEEYACSTSRGVYQRVTQEMAGDIRRRVGFLREWLRMAS